MIFWRRFDMQRILLLILALGTAPVMAESLEFYGDLRTAHDLAVFDFTKIKNAASGSWVVASIAFDKFDPNEISCLPENARKFHLGRGGGAVNPFAGMAHVTCVLSGKDTGLRFLCIWDVQPQSLFHETPPLYRYMAEIEPKEISLAICHVIDSPYPGIDRMKVEEYYMIPPTWDRHVQPAWEFWRKNPELFEKGRIKDNSGRLKELARDPNPILALMAIRTLAQAGLWTIADLPKVGPREWINYQTSLSLYYLLHYASEEACGKLAEHLGGIVNSAKTVEELYWIALGCAVHYDTPMWPPLQNSKWSYHAASQILLQIQKKSVELAKDNRPDEYLQQATAHAFKNARIHQKITEEKLKQKRNEVLPPDKNRTR
jgi:hypothetical protein